jgi:hypothetical protein
MRRSRLQRSTPARLWREIFWRRREPEPGLPPDRTFLTARFGAARAFLDAVVLPEEARAVLSLALRTSLNNPGPHLGAFVLPPNV